MKPPSVCPQCGEPLLPSAKICPACGSDEETGWKEDGDPGLDMTEEEYGEAVAREFGSGDAKQRKFGKEVLTALVVILVMAGFLLYMFRG